MRFWRRGGARPALCYQNYDARFNVFLGGGVQSVPHCAAMLSMCIFIVFLLVEMSPPPPPFVYQFEDVRFDAVWWAGWNLSLVLLCF